jgi:hypothetical protein
MSPKWPGQQGWQQLARHNTPDVDDELAQLKRDMGG